MADNNHQGAWIDRDSVEDDESATPAPPAEAAEAAVVASQRQSQLPAEAPALPVPEPSVDWTPAPVEELPSPLEPQQAQVAVREPRREEQRSLTDAWSVRMMAEAGRQARQAEERQQREWRDHQVKLRDLAAEEEQAACAELGGRRFLAREEDREWQGVMEQVAAVQSVMSRELGRKRNAELMEVGHAVRLDHEMMDEEDASRLTQEAAYQAYVRREGTRKRAARGVPPRPSLETLVDPTPSIPAGAGEAWEWVVVAPTRGDGPAPPDDDPAVVAVAALFTDDRVEWMGIGNVLFARTVEESMQSTIEETLVEHAIIDPFTAAPSRRKAGVS